MWQISSVPDNLCLGSSAPALKQGGGCSVEMAHKHRTTTAKRETLPYSGPVAHPPNPAAHGGECIVDHCPCGATRRTNVSGAAKERGEWIEPKSGRSGTVWGDQQYDAKGYPPRLGTVRFKSWEAHRALEAMAAKSGKGRTAVIEELVLQAARKKTT